MERVRNCRVDGGPLVVVWDLGYMHSSTFVENENSSKKSPLTWARCETCGLVQLTHNIDFDNTYRQYWYNSGLNPSMVSSLKDVVRSVEKAISYGDVVVDIGSNDSTLLGLYRKNKNVFRVGFEPALNINSHENADLLIPDFFNRYAYEEYMGRTKAKVITAIAMFYDLPDPNTFVSDVAHILHPAGTFVIQMTDLVAMLQANAFDNTCAEHLECYTVAGTIALLENHGLEVYDAQRNDVNGGSVRLYIGHKNTHPILKTVPDILDHEVKTLAEDSLERLRDRIDLYREKTMNFIHEEVVIKGKTMLALGASTKGNTLLQYYGIDNTLIPFIGEINKEKFGLKTVGTHLKIISETDVIAMHPDYILVLPWHFKENFKKILRPYLNKGGKVIFPLPYPHLLDKHTEIKI